MVFARQCLAFRLLDRPEDWRRYADEIDLFCEGNQKITLDFPAPHESKSFSRLFRWGDWG
jgi:hypothetical protein